jgi:ATP/maltotriose-dependent transcriptional regulator MalT
LGNQALILRVRGDPDGALALISEQEQICRELGEPTDLAISLANQAVILNAQGDLARAEVLAAETCALAV